MKSARSLIFPLVAGLVLIGAGITAYYVQGGTGTREIAVTSPKKGASIPLDSVTPISWSGLGGLPRTAVIIVSLTDGPTNGQVLYQPLPRNSTLSWEVKETLNDDILTRIQAGTYRLHIEIYKTGVCTQAACTDTPSPSQVPLLAEGYSEPFTIVPSY